MFEYDELEKDFIEFLKKLNLDEKIPYANSIIVCDADKCEQYRDKWLKNEIPYEHGVLIYLITKIKPYSDEVRETKSGWISPVDWVVSNYNKFKHYL